ncbi:MAG TPA: glycosyltransferase family 1 protein [Thermodesulfobacteriota bacterium]|nr:glycosyltransferase family 1 protein [Thermodesulfobacteriota bacterium]
MRIGINALYLLPGRVGGSETYVRNLVKWLPRVAPSNEYVIFINRESAGVFEGLAPGARIVECPVNASSRPKRILWEQIALPFQAYKYGLDVLLSAGMTAPFFSPVPSVVVIYDLQHINQPENFGRWYLFFLRTIIYLSAKRSVGIITLSRKSKEDIERHYRIGPGDIGVTWMASDSGAFHIRSASEVASVRKKYGLPESFILYIASSLPHKNYQRLLEAFKTVKGTLKDMKLVLIGARDYGHDAIAAKIGELGLADDVMFLGWLPFEDIPLIYAASKLFVFPSLHEGFGIPVVEAFACGVPVVCSGIEPLVEVAGGAALLVDPTSVDEIASGIIRAVTDASLRERLVRDGLKRASEFSWEKTAEATLSFLGRHVKGGA